jgi:hypothetical protein
MLIEYTDPDERARRLVDLHEIERRVTLRIGTMPPVVAIADEDMDRSTDSKTSAVHFLRFDLDAGQIAALKNGSAAEFAIDHPHYHEHAALSPDTRAALAADLD